METVCGARHPSDIGFTLPHEHTYFDQWHVPGRFDYGGQISSHALLAAELTAFAARGGSCLVDLTLPGTGRDPQRVRQLSLASGVHIVIGCGYYREPYYPAWARVDQRSVTDLAEDFIIECQQGIAGTDIRPGIIGEIGCHKSWVSAQEERILRAAALAQQVTGLTITTHAVYSDVGLNQLQLLLEAGGNPERIIIGHCDTYPSLRFYRELLSCGANIQFDSFGFKTPDAIATETLALSLILELLDEGWEDRLLLSQDVCYPERLRLFGGSGFTYLQDAVLPELASRGVSDGTLEKLTQENPRRLLTVCDPKDYRRS